METLTSTLAGLDLDLQGIEGKSFDARLEEEENGTYQNYAPRARTRPSVAETRRELEDEFLNPSPRFNSEWLNRLQR